MEYTENTLLRYMDYLKRYDEIIAETPEEFKKDLSKEYFLRKLAVEIHYTVNGVRPIIKNRNEILAQYKEKIGTYGL